MVENANVDAPEVQFLTKHQIGGEACIYRYCVGDDDPLNSLWVFEFYWAHYIIVKTGALCEDKDE